MVTVELAGEFASLYLAVAVSGDGGLVQQAEVMLAGWTQPASSPVLVGEHGRGAR